MTSFFGLTYKSMQNNDFSRLFHFPFHLDMNCNKPKQHIVQVVHLLLKPFRIINRMWWFAIKCAKVTKNRKFSCLLPLQFDVSFDINQPLNFVLWSCPPFISYFFILSFRVEFPLLGANAYNFEALLFFRFNVVLHGTSAVRFAKQRGAYAQDMLTPCLLDSQEAISMCTS